MQFFKDLALENWMVVSQFLVMYRIKGISMDIHASDATAEVTKKYFMSHRICVIYFPPKYVIMANEYIKHLTILRSIDSLFIKIYPEAAAISIVGDFNDSDDNQLLQNDCFRQDRFRGSNILEKNITDCHNVYRDIQILAPIGQKLDPCLEIFL